MHRRTLRVLTAVVVAASATLAACGGVDPIAREAAGSTMPGKTFRPGMLCGVADHGQTSGSVACRRDQDSDGEGRGRGGAGAAVAPPEDPADGVSAVGGLA